ncbi:MAG: hypothetical protein ABMA25_04475 [Ilumatobacteraceae bacterium]
MRTRLLILLAGVAAGPLVASAVSADEQPRLDDVQFDASRTSLTAESVSRDSDGDGWVDWYERFEGTDPNDPNSYPGAAQLEIVDNRIVLQATNLPDRFVIVDRATPEVLKTPEAAIPALVGMVQDLRAGTSTGKVLQTMIGELGKYGGSVPSLDGILGQAEKDSAIGVDLGPRVGGIQMGLISGLSAEVGGNQQGGLSVRFVKTWDEATKPAQTVTFHYLPDDEAFIEHGVLVWSPTTGGTSTVEWYKVNGTETSRWLRHFDSKGKLVWKQELDKDDNPVGPVITVTSTPVTAAPVTAAPVTAAKDTNTTVSTPASVTTPTTVGDYADPEYQRPQLLSPEEMAARAEFLKGLTGRFGSTIDLPPGPKEKPGVSDPADPECKGPFCVLFTVVEAPDLSNVNGGDRINPSFLPEGPPITIR